MKCIVGHCAHLFNEMDFRGDVCLPCYQKITTGWRKRQIENIKVKTDVEFYNELRNDVIEEVAKEIDNIKFGETPHLFAAYIRGLKK
jgi:hypothetical protein